MCGITGIIGPAATDQRLLGTMTDRLAHRGPEDSGTHHDGACALGHRRLAIIDRAGGHEPILDAEGRSAIVYNGEIYNHTALRNALEAEGVHFRTRTDGEVPLQLIARARDPGSALRQLDGMFAFAIWEPDAAPGGRLLLARDPYGIKPLYWTQTRTDFLFASEMKALLAHDEVPAELDHDAVREKHVFEHLLPGRNWLKGIHAVPPGHFLTLEQGRTQITRYHEPRTAELPPDKDAIAQSIHTRLRAAVAKQLMSETPVGVILSGGLDSSLVAAHFAKEADDLLTFSVAGDEENADLRAARRVAEHLGTTHHETIFTRDDLDRDLAMVVWHNEEIDHETYFFHPLFALMKPHATVALSGQAADEVFGGYERYRDLAAHRTRLKARAARAYPDRPDRFDRLIDAQYADLHTALAWERGAQLEQFQLRLVDRESMSASTEVRVPFLDEDVVALGRALPTEELIAGATEKVALRRAAGRVDLPKEILERRKVPAGRRTAGSVVESFEADAARIGARRNNENGTAADILDPAQTLMLALFTEIFINRRGDAPRGLAWNDLV